MLDVVLASGKMEEQFVFAHAIFLASWKKIGISFFVIMQNNCSKISKRFPTDMWTKYSTMQIFKF